MKSYRVLWLCLVIGMAIGFVSCGKDDSEESIPSSLVGTWSRLVSEDGESYTETIKFNANGTGTISVDQISFDFDYSVSGSNLTLNIDAGSESSSETVAYVIQGNTLKLTYEGESITYTRVN